MLLFAKLPLFWTAIVHLKGLTVQFARAADTTVRVIEIPDLQAPISS
jgi:hypothetical protein